MSTAACCRFPNFKSVAALLLIFWGLDAAPQLLAHWSFDSSSTNTYYDVTGHGYDAVSTNLGLTDGIRGRALSLSGSNYELVVQNSSTAFAQSNFSLEAWYYSNVDPATQITIGAKIFEFAYVKSGVRNGFSLYINESGVADFSMANASGSEWFDAYSTTVLQARTWYHLAITYDGSNMRLYVNGKLEGMKSQPGGYALPNANARIGCESLSDGSVRCFIDGKLDELRYYNYSLVGDTIDAHYNREAPLSGKPALVAHWSFDASSGNTFSDVTGHGFDASSPNVAVAEGVKGNALSLPGGGYEMIVANSLNRFNFSTFSIETWFYSNTPLVGDTDNVILTYSTYAPGIAEGFNFKTDMEGRLHFSLARQDGASWVYVDSRDSILQAKRWYHLAATYDGSTMCVYVNGVLANSTAYVGGFKYPEENARIGNECMVGGSPRYFIDGKIDELKVYNYALSPDTLRAHSLDFKLNQKDVNLGMQTVYAKADEQVWIPIFLANYEDSLPISACQFSIVVDTSVITFEDAIIDSGIANHWTMMMNPAKHDTIRFAMGGTTQKLGYGEGELLRCKFRVKAGAQKGQYSNIAIQNVLLDEDTTCVTTTPGKIIVDEVVIHYGDVTGNGITNALDGAKILQNVVGSITLPDSTVPNFTQTVADVSGNGTVTSFDAALVFQYSVGLISQFPVQKKMALRKGLEAPRDTLAELTLQLSKNDQSQTTYQLRGRNLRGYVAGQFVITYQPEAVRLDSGWLETPIRNSDLESHIDASARYLNVALTTNDYINADSSVNLVEILVPPVSGSQAKSALVLKSALINEGRILARILPTNTTGSEPGIQLRQLHSPAVQQVGATLRIDNPAQLPVVVGVYDLRGRQLSVHLFAAANTVVQLSLNDLLPGVYLTKVRVGTEQSVRTFIVGR